MVYSSHDLANFLTYFQTLLFHIAVSVLQCSNFKMILNSIYKFLNVCPFDYTAVAGSGKVGPVNQVNHTSWVAVVTPTDRPKSVRNRCLIELFCGVFVLSLPF